MAYSSNATTLTPLEELLAQNTSDRARWLHQLVADQRAQITALNRSIDDLEDGFDKNKELMEESMNNFFLIVNAIVVFLVQVRCQYC